MLTTRAVIQSGIVANVILVGDDFDPADASFGTTFPCTENVQIGWTYDGTAFIPPPSPAPEPLTVSDFQNAIQHHVDETARARRYDSGVSLASYVASTDPEWAAEAQAFVAWRDAVWIYAYAELDKVMNEEREAPTVEGFIGELPVIEWPV